MSCEDESAPRIRFSFASAQREHENLTFPQIRAHYRGSIRKMMLHLLYTWNPAENK